MKKITKAALILVMVFTVFLSVDQSYAYWYSVDPTSADATGTVVIGTWNPILVWSIGTTYDIGAIVTHNGSTWVSIKASNSGKEPSLSKPGSNWWAPYTG